METPLDAADFNAIAREQLAAQLVAIMDAHFHRPTLEEKQRILELAARQIRSQPQAA